MADSPHSAPMDVVRAAFEQLGWNMTPVNALEEQLEAEKQRLNTFELRTEEFLDSQGYSPMEVDELLVSFHVSFPALRPSE